MRLESKLTALEQRVLALRDHDLPPWANDGGSLAFNAIRLSLAVRTDEEYRQHLRLGLGACWTLGVANRPHRQK